MRILRFDDWIVERMKIRPVTNAELDTVKELIDKSVANTTTSQSTDYRSKKLRSLYGAFDQYYKMKFINSDIYYRSKLYDAHDHTMNERFNVWAKNLYGSALLKKHEARANSKSIKEPKLFATMYCAFEKYGTQNDYEANKIIRYYMDRLIRQYNTTDDVIIDIFFE